MNQKGFANIVVVMLVVILAGAVGYFALIKRPILTTPGTSSLAQNTAPPDTTPQWISYTNREHKYRVSYPPDWKLGSVTAEPSPAAIRFTKITKQNGTYLNDAVIDIIVEPNPLNTTPTEAWYRAWAAQIPAGINLEGIEIKETMFKNVRALIINNSSVFFAKGSNMFRIQWHVAGDYDSSLVTSTEQNFEQLLSTFEFLD